MQMELLLLEDVEDLGRSGDLVKVKPGFARNFLVPQKKAVVASKFALRLREKLMEERRLKAAQDLREAEELVARMAGCEFTTIVKVDQEGHLYGSVNAADLVHMLGENGFVVAKGQVVLDRPIKSLGSYTIHLKLKEGVTTSFVLHVESDHPIQSKEVETKETPEESE